jgi:uncharacterized protein (TIGR03435 family)
MGMSSGNGILTISRSSLFGVLGTCYDINPVRVITNSAMPDGKFDFVIKTADKSEANAHKWLREAVEATFDLRAKRETREMTVYVLSAPKPDESHLTVTVSTGGSSSRSGPGGMSGINQSISSLASYLEGKLGKPVVDETRLTNHYDLELKWKETPDERPPAETIVRAVKEQLGLELTTATRAVEVVVVEKRPKEKSKEAKN